jgi:cyclophilin family peptidyl-prolyl cis-trans isomerase
VLFYSFGSVVEGYDVIKKVESYGSQSGSTKAKIVVADCGQL